MLPRRVQGAGAAEELAEGLAAAARLVPPPDVIALVRGGGSLEDLWAFNEESVARAVRGCPIPVVTGIGHETDFTIADFVADLRELEVTPHIAENVKKKGGFAIDGRTTRHAGYAVSLRIRKRIEEAFGWIKTIGNLRKTRHRGIDKVDWYFTLAISAYNLVRVRNLGVAA